ncbi:MAG: VCBS repeat-containing protein [Propionibacteriales bacterium]|nr:VCBS repeat-containing protein [Propionibacteriales bacterium]
MKPLALFVSCASSLALLLGGATAPAAATPIITQQAVPTQVTSTAAAPDMDGDGLGDVAGIARVSTTESEVRVTYGDNVKSGTLRYADLTGTTGTLSGPLLARDFDGDGFTDLVVVGAPTSGTAKLFLIKGSKAGLSPASVTTIESPSGLSFQTDSDDGTGALALVTSPIPRLVATVEIPGLQVEDHFSLVAYSLGTDGRPTGDPTRIVPGVAGIPHLKGRFRTASLASSGNQLFVGAPAARVGGASGAGAVLPLTFGATGVTAHKVITANTARVPGKPTSQALFGDSLAAWGGYLAVGVPGANSGKVYGAGAVQLFKIGATTLKPVKRYTQETKGIPGKSGFKDAFGTAVAIGRVCASVTGLIVGAPGKSFGVYDRRSGAVNVIPLAKKAGCKARQLYEGHGFVTNASFYRFGSSLGVVSDKGDPVAHLAIGSPGLFAGDSSREGSLLVLSQHSLALKSGFYTALSSR